MIKWVDLLGFLGVVTLLFGFTAYLTAYFLAKALQRLSERESTAREGAEHEIPSPEIPQPRESGEEARKRAA